MAIGVEGKWNNIPPALSFYLLANPDDWEQVLIINWKHTCIWWLWVGDWWDVEMKGDEGQERTGALDDDENGVL